MLLNDLCSMEMQAVASVTVAWLVFRHIFVIWDHMVVLSKNILQHFTGHWLWFDRFIVMVLSVMSDVVYIGHILHCSDQFLSRSHEGDIVPADGCGDVHWWPASGAHVSPAAHWEVWLQQGAVKSPRVRTCHVWAHGCVEVRQRCSSHGCC